MSDYLAYQAKYRDTPRDSDRELIRLIGERVPRGGRVLDVGCSTGNLLRHLYTARTGLLLMGTDLDQASLDEFRAIERASGAEAQRVGDVMILPNRSCFVGDVADSSESWDWLGLDFFDAIIANALFYCLTDEQVATALSKLVRILKPGGHLFIWDLLHHWEQRLTITEESERYGKPTIHIRPWSLLHNMAADTGFSMCEIIPQDQPYLLEPDDPTDLTSWTFPDSWARGGISFRGGLAQPWCHAILTR